MCVFLDYLRPFVSFPEWIKPHFLLHVIQFPECVWVSLHALAVCIYMCVYTCVCVSSYKKRSCHLNQDCKVMCFSLKYFPQLWIKGLIVFNINEKSICIHVYYYFIYREFVFVYVCCGDINILSQQCEELSFWGTKKFHDITARRKLG